MKHHASHRIIVKRLRPKLQNKGLGILIILLCFFSVQVFSQVTVTIDFDQEGRSYSKYIFGKNNSLSGKPESPLLADEWTRLKDSGITIFRDNGGNNSTKYNWKRKLSSHPDWYNNVYANDWDFRAKSLAEKFPDRQGIFGLQLLGKAAKTNEQNFNEWEYNQAQWWEGVHQNLAGGGTVNPEGGDALVDGDPELYLMDWTPDSTVGIFDHWFDANGLGLNREQFQYWCMDNEPSIWNGTHDDVAANNETAEEYMQKYFAVAKAARAKFPEIKIIGPIIANEWQWYNWHNKRIAYNGKTYGFLEYFILRIGEEQKALGIKLLDVLSIHFYPKNQDVSKVVQFHRVFFDENYVYPDANGVKTVNGGWDDSINKEYIFKRASDWMEEYIGPGHEVGLGMTETGVNISDQNGVAVWYASSLGEFMKHDVEIFTPWSWQPSMWEVVNLFTEYSHDQYYDATSSNEELISAYTTADENTSHVTSILVNRSINSTEKVKLNIDGVYVDKDYVSAYQLSDIGNDETFKSDQDNALKETTVDIGYQTISLSLPPLSVVAVSFQTTDEVLTGFELQIDKEGFKIYPNPSNGKFLNIESKRNDMNRLDIVNLDGNVLKTFNHPTGHVELSDVPDGIYIVRIHSEHGQVEQKIIIQ